MIRLSMLTVVILGVGLGIVAVADADKEATPPMDERLKGTLMKIGREYVWVMDKDGNEIKLHVDKSMTKQDNMVSGWPPSSEPFCPVPLFDPLVASSNTSLS